MLAGDNDLVYQRVFSRNELYAAVVNVTETM